MSATPDQSFNSQTWIPKGTGRSSGGGLDSAWTVRGLGLNGLLVGLLGLTGCGSSRETGPAEPMTAVPTGRIEASPGAVAGRVIAQGLLLPADGIVKIFSAPGDVVTELPVSVGATVQRGQLLAVMRSQAAIVAKRAAIEQQKADALREQSSAITQAELRVAAAELKLRQVQMQQANLGEKKQLLERGEKQILAAEEILQSLRRISTDSLTREFVGRLDVQRQEIELEDSRLQLAQQHSDFRQACLEIELAEQAASQEVESARALLKLAQDSDAARLLEVQLAALESESEHSILKSPCDGVVLSVGATVGGSAVQVPLLELANLDHIVCEAEVNVADANRIAVGQKATIRSRVMTERQLQGIVTEKSRLVGRPRLRTPDPLAAADYRTVVVMVQLDDPAWASQWLQLQVEVVFEP